MSNKGQLQQYIGSVRFYKHIILMSVGMMILVPTILSIIFGVQSKLLLKEKAKIEVRLEAAEKNLQELQQQKQVAEVLDVHEDSPRTTLAAKESESWELILVNEGNPLDAGYEVKLATVIGGQKVDARIIKSLNAMMGQMRQEGLRPIVCSGYRSIEKQSRLFYEYIDEKLKAGWDYSDAFYKAKTRIALPGASEHHTGLAVDIVGMSHQSLDDAQANTKEAKWLEEHCAEYGFILRYPKDKTDITGVDYESWHFRYVGEDAAAYMMKNDLTLEEFLEEVDKL